MQKEKGKMFGKSLHRCCTRLKRRRSPAAPPQSQNALHVPSSSSSAVFKNFNSLYDPAAASESETLTGFGSGSTSRALTTADEDEDEDAASDSEPDLSTVFASRRLLRPASTGRTNSIVEEGEGGRVGFGAVPKMSPDPYGDFKRSMEEMVAALGLSGAGGGGHQHHQHQHQQRRRRSLQLSGAHQLRLQELLLCYLALNRKSAHKYIVGAFVDVLRGLSANGD